MYSTILLGNEALGCFSFVDFFYLCFLAFFSWGVGVLQGGHGVVGADADQDGEGRSGHARDTHAGGDLEGDRGTHHLRARGRRRLARAGALARGGNIFGVLLVLCGIMEYYGLMERCGIMKYCEVVGLLRDEMLRDNRVLQL